MCPTPHQQQVPFHLPPLPRYRPRAFECALVERRPYLGAAGSYLRRRPSSNAPSRAAAAAAATAASARRAPAGRRGFRETPQLRVRHLLLLLRDIGGGDARSDGADGGAGEHEAIGVVHLLRSREHGPAFGLHTVHGPDKRRLLVAQVVQRAACRRGLPAPSRASPGRARGGPPGRARPRSRPPRPRLRRRLPRQDGRRGPPSPA